MLTRGDDFVHITFCRLKELTVNNVLHNFDYVNYLYQLYDLYEKL